MEKHPSCENIGASKSSQCVVRIQQTAEIFRKYWRKMNTKDILRDKLVVHNPFMGMELVKDWNHDEITPSHSRHSLVIQPVASTDLLVWCNFLAQLSKITLSIWVFPKTGVPQNGWFIVENSIKMDDLGVPLFSETSIYYLVVWIQFETFPKSAKLDQIGSSSPKITLEHSKTFQKHHLWKYNHTQCMHILTNPPLIWTLWVIPRVLTVLIWQAPEFGNKFDSLYASTGLNTPTPQPPHPCAKWRTISPRAYFCIASAHGWAVPNTPGAVIDYWCYLR